MVAGAGFHVSAIDLRGVANSTTSVVIALLSLIAVAVLGYGLLRALVLNRRNQVIVADVVTPGGHDTTAEISILSSVVRQRVEHNIGDQREQVVRIGKTILTSAFGRQKPQLNYDVVTHVQRDANDSIATLSAALRAVVPGKADPFAALFSAILPAPRGLLVTVTVLHRGSDAEPRLGAAVDVARLDRRPVASTVFWEPESAAAGVRSGVNERFLDLFEPVARWIAVRLVVTLMVTPRWAKSQARQGLERLLAGGLFLQAMRDFTAHALAFGEQARAELEQARQRMPDLALPVTTLAGVHERMGWARQAAGQPELASDSFLRAVGRWRQAESITRDSGLADQEQRLTILADRRLKAQLQTGDPVLQKAALTELAKVDPELIPAGLWGNKVWIYNRCCLYALASGAEPGAGHQRRALRWLGLALIGDRATGSWDYAARDDPELEAIRAMLPPFLATLRSVARRELEEISEAEAVRLVAGVLAHHDLAHRDEARKEPSPGPGKTG